MKLRALIAGLALFSAGLLAGCGGDGKLGPFEGDWVSATAGRLSFEEKKWSDGDGDSGDYSFWGDYPVFTIVFQSSAGPSEKVATFADENTFELCDAGVGGALVNCHDFVYDKPTLH